MKDTMVENMWNPEGSCGKLEKTAGYVLQVGKGGKT